MNINRDYLIINDVKKSNIKLDNGSMFFYITDKNTQNIFVNLVINVSNNDLIQKYANIENAEDYTLTMNIVKPSNTYKVIEGKLHDKEKAIFEFNLSEDCCDEIGPYRCELLTKCNINGHEETTTSNKLTYKVKSSVLNDLDDIVEAPEYPVVIQLLDKLSDIEQYEEDRRANELARQLAEQQRQTRFDALDADMVDGIQEMDDKVEDVENRITTKEQAVDTLIVDTKADIGEYKVAKDQEIDDYKTAKDTEINNAITAQDNKIDTAITSQNDRIAVVENNVVAQNNKLDTLETKATTHEARITAVEAKNTEQDGRLDIAENRLANIGNDITNTMQPIIDEHTSRLEAIEAIDVAQNNRLDNIEAKNQQQDDRLLDIEKVNNRQNIDIKCLYGASQTIDVTKESNSIYLQNSNNGFTIVDEIKGNTLVNCNKEPDKELILNGNINTSGDNTVTITEGVDGGLVDVALEGNTLVNVSKTKDSTAITMAYTVENSGNHIALQGDIDGSCRPVITGNTLWIDNDTEEVLTAFDETKNLRLQSSFEDNLVTQEMVDSGEEVADNLGKYRVDYKVTGKNLFDKSKALDGREITNTALTPNAKWFVTDFIPVIPNTSYKISGKDTGNSVLYYDKNKQVLKDGLGGTSLITIPNNARYVRLNGFLTQKDTFQVEEGNTATEYEPYKEYTKTLYLNLPLLEGDTIEEKDGGIYHVHRSKSRVLNGSEDWKTVNDSYARLLLAPKPKLNNEKRCENYMCDTLKKSNNLSLESGMFINDAIRVKTEFISNAEEAKQWFAENPTTVVYSLETPTCELIEQSNLAIPSYTNGHLDFNTAVPIEKVEFKPFSEELTYLYANTQYTVQFMSDKATTADITLGGTQLLAQNIVAGLNRISITTPATLTDNKLVISGVGANISEAVITDTNRQFAYFEGMKSVGECEENKIEIISQNKNLFDGETESGIYSFADGVTVDENDNYSRTVNYINVKDIDKITISSNQTTYGFRVYLYDANKKHIENIIVYSNNSLNVSKASYIRMIYNSKIDKNTFQIETGTEVTSYSSYTSNKQQLTHEPLRAVGNVKDRYVLIDGKWYIERNFDEKVLNGTENYTLDASTQLGDYFVVSSNGLPTINNGNLYVKCDKLPAYYGSIYTKPTRGIYYVQKLKFKLLKSELPSVDIDNFKTWLSNNPIRVVYQLETPVYEPIDYNPLEVYSDVTHITTNSAVPTNITIKNHGFNCLLKPSTTYTISSNLGLNTVTTPSTLTEDCLRFMDTDTSDVTTMRDVLVLEGDWTTKADSIPANFSGIESAFEQQLVTDEEDEHHGKYKVNVRVTNESVTAENNLALYINEPLRGIGSVKDKIYVKDNKVVVERKYGARAYQDGDFGTYPTDKVNTVYPLAEPVYEQVEYNGVKLSIEIFENSTLSYNSNVAVTSTVRYSYSVPLVNAVAQTANITDQQDSMIIDLATQVAVMEMMLM